MLTYAWLGYMSCALFRYHSVRPDDAYFQLARCCRREGSRKLHDRPVRFKYNSFHALCILHMKGMYGNKRYSLPWFSPFGFVDANKSWPWTWANPPLHGIFSLARSCIASSNEWEDEFLWPQRSAAAADHQNVSIASTSSTTIGGTCWIADSKMVAKTVISLSAQNDLVMPSVFLKCWDWSKCVCTLQKNLLHIDFNSKLNLCVLVQPQLENE